MVFQRKMAAIRRYYATLDPAAAAFFPSREHVAAGTVARDGMSADIPEMFFTSASMIAAVNGILAGAGAASLLDAAGVSLPVAVIAGVAAALLVYGLHLLWMHRRGGPAMAYK